MKAQRKGFSTKGYRLLRRKRGKNKAPDGAESLRVIACETAREWVQEIEPEIVETDGQCDSPETTAEGDGAQDATISSVQEIEPEIIEIDEDFDAAGLFAVEGEAVHDERMSSVQEIEPEIVETEKNGEAEVARVPDSSSASLGGAADKAFEEALTVERDAVQRQAQAPRRRISRMTKKCADGTASKDALANSKSDAQKRLKNQEIDNPEVSSRLTNMSMRHVGSRPDWFDIEPLSLPGVVRQCNDLYYRIESSLVRREKQMFLLTGREGIGKTTFLAQVYAKLEHAPLGVLTLAPGIPKKSPFRALRNILEQRFYISGKANFACIERFVRSAMAAIIASDGDVDAEKVEMDIDAILEMWRLTRAKSKPARAVPPPLKTQIVSMESVLAAHKMQKNSGLDEQNSETAVPPDNGATSTTGDSPQADGQNVETTDKAPGNLDTDDADCRRGKNDAAGDCRSSDRASASHSDRREGKRTEASAKSASNDPVSATLRVPDSLEIDMDETLIACEIERLVPALFHLLRADLRKNAIVIVIDDAEQYDRYSLEILCRIYEMLDGGPVALLWTVSDPKRLPESIQNKPYLKRFQLDPMSDTDLTLLTKHVFRRLGESREKKLVPQEICRHIAQRAYGSPKRAIELIREHFKPDQIIHWSEAIEKIRHKSLPRDVEASIVERFESCDDAEKILLQVASHLMAPFTCATLQSIAAGLGKGYTVDAPRCALAFKALRKKGFFDRSEESLNRMTPMFVFRHDCERIVIAKSTQSALLGTIYARAAQWYTLVNFNGVYDETIGDMWRCNQSFDAACRNYERAAYRAYRQARYTKAWPLFSKLMKCLPESDLARKMAVSLDGARIAFRIGLIDEAFRLCRWTCYNAMKLSAYAQAARATLQIAEILVEIGSIRHVMRYIRRTRALLNVAGDIRLAVELEIVMARYALALSQRNRVRALVTKIQSMAKGVELEPTVLHKIALIHATVEYDFGNPLIAIQEFEKLVADCESTGDVWMRAVCYHMLGKAHDRSENLSAALESWNRALGLAQEMNDVVLHAAILADIADGALSLEAMRTARVAIEECLVAAQQTRQRVLIARCLANAAYLQHVEGQHETAMRTLRKAHRSACSLRIMNIWTRTLSLLAWFYRQVDSGLYRPNKANEIYRRLIAVFERYRQPLATARIVPEYARFLSSIHQNMTALSQCRKLRLVYQEFGIAQGVEKIDALIDSINRASDGERAGENCSD